MLAKMCVVLCLAASPVYAGPFTWTMNGTIGNAYNESEAETQGFGGVFTKGDAFVWTLTMDSSAKDGDPVVGCGS